MGMYAYITDEDRITKRRCDDPEVNEAFQGAVALDPSLMIEQRVEYRPGKWIWSKDVPYTYFNLYHETPAFDGSAYQMRYQASGSGSKQIVMAYLHGIYNGILHHTIPPLDAVIKEG